MLNSNLIDKMLDDDSDNDSCTMFYSNSTPPVEMVIQLENNQEVLIYINQDDDPVTLAKKFCY